MLNWQIAYTSFITYINVFPFILTLDISRWVEFHQAATLTAGWALLRIPTGHRSYVEQWTEQSTENNLNIMKSIHVSQKKNSGKDMTVKGRRRHSVLWTSYILPVTVTPPSMDSEKVWTGEFWSMTKIPKKQNLNYSILLNFIKWKILFFQGFWNLLR